MLASKENISKILIYIFLVLFSTLLFFTKAKTTIPLIVDSNFYLSMFYQYQGATYDEARNKVFAKFNLNWKEEIQQNMLFNKKGYQDSYAFFSKRPLYPFVSAKINSIVKNDILALYIPTYLALIGIILITYYFSTKVLSNIIALISTTAFLAVTRIVEWATIYATDVIGAFFWMSQLFLLYKFIEDGKKIYLTIYVLNVSVSILNREQSLLMLPLSLFALLLARHFKLKKHVAFIKKICITTLALTVAYIVISAGLKLPSVYDNLLFLESRFGLYEKNLSIYSMLDFYFSSLGNANFALFFDMLQHPFELLILIVGTFGIIKSLQKKKLETAQLLLICSAISAYLSLFLSPFYSIRFFFPAQIALSVFTIWFLNQVIIKRKLNV